MEHPSGTDGTNGSPDDDGDPLFRYDRPIFRDKTLLEIGHLPDPDKVVGRDTQMQRVANALNPAIFGEAPTALLIFGKTGTGKSLTARMVTERLKPEAAERGTSVETVILDCGEETTETAAVKTIANKLNDADETGVTVPLRGLSKSDYYKRLWTIVDTMTDIVFVIFDEVDMLEDDEVLRTLSRARENQKIVDSRVGIIGISNQLDYPDNLSERVKSSLQHTDLVFPAYDANQLNEILERRKEAFKPGVLTDDVIPLVSALAAREHGDARKAIDILRIAGDIAKDEDAEMVTEAHARQAKEQTEINRVRELIDGETQLAKLVLSALVLQAEQQEGAVPTQAVYEQYTQIATAMDTKTVSERRVSDILKQFNFHSVVRSERVGRGRGRGITNRHRIIEDLDIVKKALSRDADITYFE
ncbi:Cdc6/Cdc18 family protein [Haloplanus natans]|uniref:Cdc6/Cdc18 family protein n=1 Tax=Haloplanus natans TaxID=376171 RepID=UPI0006778A04|nr:AAA family ATPase [Haloplanus natans]